MDDKPPGVMNDFPIQTGYSYNQATHGHNVRIVDDITRSILIDCLLLDERLVMVSVQQLVICVHNGR